MLNQQFKGPNISFIWVIADKTGQQNITAKYPLDNKSIYCHHCFDYLGYLQGQSLYLSRDIYFFCGKCQEKIIESQKGESSM